MSNQDQSLLAGAQVEDRYEVLTKLGEGGFGAVYKARQRTTGQTVALKVMRLPETGGSEQAERRAARFLREARLSADLHHPNIVQLVDTGRGQGGGLYSVFAFAPGDDLAAVIAREGALAPREAQHLMLEVLDALACAHAAGVIHRDLKPSNIMVVPSGARRNALVLDFGIGAVIDPPAGESGSRLTGSGDAVGTPGYGAPEQWRGVEPSARADLFSWGLVFLECLLGEPVYRGTAAEIFYQLLGPDPVPIPPALDGHPLGDVLRSALRKDVDARDVTARSLFAALDACDLRDLSREALRAPDSAAPAAAPSTLSLSDTGPRAAAERRQVTALSCHVRLHDRAAGEDADDTLRTALTSAAAIARRHRGRVVSGLGDHLLVYFGYPRAEEGDALRAGRAALAIAETVPASVGLHTGIILADDAGGLDVALGETPRLAARLAATAAPGSVAVTAAAHGLLRASFDLDADPGADTFLLRRERSTETPGATREGPLVGRAQELSLLLDRWRRTPGGAGSAGLITGEPGIGKSRLVQELRRAVSEPHLFLEGRCSPDTQNNALFPVIDLLSRAVGLDHEADSPDARTKRLEAEIARLGLSLPETMPVLLPLFSLPIAAPYAPLDVSPQRLKTLTLNAAVSLLSSMAERRPLLLLVEDLHWADPTTNELLAQLVREAPSFPMCLLLTARPEYAPSFPTMGMLQLPLGRLGRRDVEALVTDLMGKKAVPAEVLDQVAARTEGVPLFVEELTRMMTDSGVLVERGDHYDLAGRLADLEMPGTLRALLTSRLDRMGRAKETAQVAAALGREFSVEVLSAVSPLAPGEVQEDLDRLADAGLVLRKRRSRDPVAVFKHALVRDAAYESLSREAQREVHGKIAGALEERFPEVVRGRPDTLAYHLSSAGVHDRASEYFSKAAENARTTYANGEAITFYRGAIREARETAHAHHSLPNPWSTSILHEKLGDVLSLTGEQPAARNAYSDALGATPERERLRRARLLRKIGKSWEIHHSHEHASTSYAEAERALGVDPPSPPDEWWGERVQIYLDRLWVSYWLNRVDEMRTLVHEAQASIEEHGTAYQHVRFYQLLAMMNIRIERYVPSSMTVGYARRAMTASAQTEDPGEAAAVRFVLFFALVLCDAVDEAEPHGLAVLEAAERTGSATLRARCLAYLTLIFRRRGDVQVTKSWATRCLAAADAGKMTEYIGVAHANLAWVAWRENDTETSARLGNLAIETWRPQMVCYPLQWMALWPLLSLELGRDHLPEAFTHARALIDPTQQRLPDSLDAALRSSLGAWTLGEQTRARHELCRSVDAATNLGFV